MTDEKTKNLGGRPSKYTAEMPKRLIELAKLGKTDAQVAKEFGVSRKTLQNWAADPQNPEFTEAWEMRLDFRQAYYEDMVHAVLSGVDEKCTTAKKDLLIRTLVTQFSADWGDTRKTQLEITDKTKHMSDKELESTINQKIKQLLGLKPDLKLASSDKE